MIRLHASALRIDQPADLPSAGLWMVYDGGPMVLQIDAISDEPIDLVVDLAGLEPRGPRIWALEEHDKHCRVGYWDEVAISATDVQSRLHLREHDEDAEFPGFAADRAVQLRADIDQGLPVEASVGVDFEPSSVDWLNPGESIDVNGRTITAGTRKMAIVRAGVLSEVSLVGFGANAATGQIAAAQLDAAATTEKPKEITMKDRLTALCARLGDRHRATIATAICEEHDDDAISEQVAQVEKDETAAQIAELTARVTALETENADLTAQLAAAKASEPAKPDEEGQPAAAPAGVVAAATTAGTASTIRRGQLATASAEQLRLVATGKLKLVD
jgi:hypothetical protein